MGKQIISIITLVTIILTSSFANHSIKTINGTVTHIDSEYITVKTEDGNGWILDYETGYSINDNVTIIFDTLGTADIYDDEIISITK